MQHSYPRRSSQFAAAVVASLTIGILPTGAAAAKVQGYMFPCNDNKAMCYWHKAVFTPPKGWIENPSWTERYKAVMLFHNGDQSRSEPILYVRTHAGDKAQDLDGYIQTAQARWKSKLPDSSIEPRPDFKRDGKPTLKVFLYRNPSQADQAFELTAFMKDVDEAHPETAYFFQIVLAAPKLIQIERAKASFYELLGNL